MVKGETYDKQLFESDAFRHFINIFLNKQSGVTKGCEITKDTQNITVAAGCFVIQGGLLKETTGTDNAIPTEAGYYKLVYEIDLSKTNNKDEFKQGSYKFVKAIGDYPKLTQEDLDEGGTIYQLPFCQFRITEEGIQDFADIRTRVNYGIYEKKGTVIYENAKGQSTDFAIDSKFNLSNYSKLDFVVGRSQGTTGGVIVHADLESNGKSSMSMIPLSFSDTDGDSNTFIYLSRIRIDGNNIKFLYNGRHILGGQKDMNYRLSIYKIIAYTE